VIQKSKAAGEVLTAKQAPHRPGIAPALGLRAGGDDFVIVPQTAYEKENDDVVVFKEIGSIKGARRASPNVEETNSVC
jgi:hypothetical protein